MINYDCNTRKATVVSSTPFDPSSLLSTAATTITVKELDAGDFNRLVMVSVSGVEYKVRIGYLHKFPHSLLYKLVFNGESASNVESPPRYTYKPFNFAANVQRSEVEAADIGRTAARRSTKATSKKSSTFCRKLFFQRSPLIFDLVILQSYITGKLHVPKWMCPESVLEELKFWQMDISYACTCCAEERSDDISEQSAFDSDERVPENIPETPSPTECRRRSTLNQRSSYVYSDQNALISNYEKQRRKMWEFVHYPSSSIGALVFSIISLLFVLISISILTAESFRSFSACTLDSCSRHNSRKATQLALLNLNNSDTYDMLYSNLFSANHSGNRSSYFQYNLSSSAAGAPIVLAEKSIATNDNNNNSRQLNASELNIIYGSSLSGRNATASALPYFNESGDNSTDNDDSSSDDNFNLNYDDIPCHYMSVCPRRRILQYLEFATIAWFTLELVLRIISCPTWRKFFTSPLNLIDLISTVPFYIELVLVLIREVSHNHNAHRAILLLQILRCLRAFRILKLARYFEELRILGKTLQAAKNELCMLFLFVMIAIFMFSSLVYHFEKEQPGTLYTSIPAAAWFGIATVTTVGYGDITPSTTAGKIVASIACITGVMITAFPVSILVENFNNHYKSKGKRMFLIRRFKRNIPFCKKKAVNQKKHTEITVVRSVRSSDATP